MGALTGDVTCPRRSEAGKGIDDRGQVAGIGVSDPTAAQPGLARERQMNATPPALPPHPLSEVLTASLEDWRAQPEPTV